ncbi:vWA domain-containing protein [Roseobacter cerasinus]|nr:VWA domain-containing protein [Roseobacter cerasinus]
MKHAVFATCMLAFASMPLTSQALGSCPGGRIVCADVFETESDDLVIEGIPTQFVGEVLLGDNFERMSRSQAAAALREFKGPLPPGEWPKSARAVDHNARVIVMAAAPATDIQIGFLKKSSNTVQVIVTAYDADGNELRLGPDDFAVFDFDEQAPIPFSMDVAKHSLALKVAVDTSGSMQGRLDATMRPLKAFLRRLPDHVGCSIASFSHVVTEHTNGYVRCAQAVATLPALKAGGGTDLHGTMMRSYAQLKAEDATGSLLLVMTDGYDGSNIPKSQVAAAKVGSTFVLWTDNWKKNALSGIADFEAVAMTDQVGSANLDAWMDSILSQIEDAIAFQHTLTVTLPAQNAEGDGS